MVEATYVKSRRVTKLSFTLTSRELPQSEIATLSVVGSFNGWDPEAAPLRRRRDGSYRATIEVERPGLYHYRYLLNGALWFNDGRAQGYAPNGFGEDNCTVAVPEPG